MAQITKVQLQTKIDTLLATNTEGDITAEDLRELQTDIKDSAVWFDEGSGGVDADAVVSISEGLDIIAADAALASSGNFGKTTMFVSATPSTTFSPNAYVVSLEDNNNIFVNDTFVAGLGRGDTYEFDASQGDKVTSSKGITGTYNVNGGTERPVEMASAALSGRQFFWFAFRNPNHRHIIQALALDSVVKVYGPNPTVNADGTSPDTPIQDATVSAFGFLDFTTSTDGEYYILATQPVCVTTTNQNLARDQRVLAPLDNELFGHTAGAGGGDARISALYANTNVTIYQSDGNIYNGVVNPGSPLSLNGNDGGISAGVDPNYGPNGWLIVRADAPIAGFSGADSAGTNATTFAPVGTASQVMGLPLRADGAQSSDDSIAFCSQYEGNVKIFQNDGTFVADVPLTRRGTLNSPATTLADQLHPAGGILSDVISTGTNLARGSYFVSDVPCFCIANLNEGNGSRADDDETTCYGITPEIIKAEMREDVNGFKRRRAIDSAGVETWVIS